TDFLDEAKMAEELPGRKARGRSHRKIGRASCRGRGEISGVAGSLKKKKKDADGGRATPRLRPALPPVFIFRRHRHPLMPSGFFFSSRRRHTRLVSDWSSDVCSSD